MLRRFRAWARRQTTRLRQTDPPPPYGVIQQIPVNPLPAYDTAILPPHYTNSEGRAVLSAFARVALMRLNNRINEARVAVAKRSRASNATKEVVSAYLTVLATRASEAIVTDEAWMSWVVNTVTPLIKGIADVAVAAEGPTDTSIEALTANLTLTAINHLKKRIPDDIATVSSDGIRILANTEDWGGGAGSAAPEKHSDPDELGNEGKDELYWIHLMEYDITQLRQVYRVRMR